MPKFIVIHPVEHDGVRKEEGETIELSAKAAQQLLDVGHIEPFDKKAAAKAEAEAAAKAEAEAAAKAEAEAAAKAEAEAKIEADAQVQWDADEDLRNQHANDFNSFLAGVLEQVS